MAGPLARIRRSRATDPGAPPPADEVTVETVVVAEAPTQVLPAAPAPDALPAAAEAVEVEAVVAAHAGRPNLAERSRLRRRLRYLRRVRELGFRDVGGLVFDQRRFDRENPALVTAKLDALDAVDRELRAIERALDDEEPFVDLREAGIASCPRCSALHGSDARFCPQCGLPLHGPQALAPVAPPATAEAEPAPSADPAPAPPTDP